MTASNMVGSRESCAVRILTDHREEICLAVNSNSTAAEMIKCSLSERRQIRFHSHPGDALWESQASDTVASKIILFSMSVVEPSLFVICMLDDNNCEL